ncbi:MAG: hypothetical protein MK132_20580 [Lentisphaerales bacterium]|nr:hypothetical protein [Lentisphaerales bacterium]
MRALFLIFLFISLYLHAEENAATKGEGWQAWKNLEKTILEFKEQESIDLCSGRMREGFFKFGMENIVKETKAMQPKFIREFTNKEKDTLYLITNIQNRDTVLIFKKQNDIWLFDDQNPGNFTFPEEVKNWQEISRLQSQLKQIAKQTTVYFTSRRNSNVITSPEELDLNPQLMIYYNPENNKEENFLLVKGVNFKASSTLLLAVTEKTIFGKYYACFEDGRVQTISQDFFDKNKNALGLEVSIETVNYSKEITEKLNKLLMTLSNGNYKERKKTRQEFLNSGAEVIPFLEKNKQHQDPEVRLTIQEILKDFDKKITKRRPEYKL